MWVVYSLVLMIGLSSCSSMSEILQIADVTNAAQQLDANNETVLANTRFGFQLFQKIYQPDKNLFVSPLSISTALAMTMNGAVGTTQQEIAQTLAFPSRDLELVNADFANLQKSLQVISPQVKLQIANSLWGREDIEFQPAFLQTNSDYFNATLRQLNFTDPQAAATINWWVSDNTNGKIKKIVDQVGAHTILFLINAIYFKGDWAMAFDPKKTREQDFFLSNGLTKKVQMMSQTGKYAAYRGQDFQVIRLPYDNGRLGMYVFLPNADLLLKTLIKNLTIDNWKQWQSEFQQEQGDIALPRFKIEYETRLNPYLSDLGMKTAFIPNQADFSRISQQPTDLHIGEVKHKSYIEVAEEGTEAAAVTSVQIRTTAIQPNRLHFIANRPFFFAIEDQWTSSLLFLGTVVNP